MPFLLCQGQDAEKVISYSQFEPVYCEINLVSGHNILRFDYEGHVCEYLKSWIFKLYTKNTKLNILFGSLIHGKSDPCNT